MRQTVSVQVNQALISHMRMFCNYCFVVNGSDSSLLSILLLTISPLGGMKLPIPVPLRLLSTSLKPQPVIVYMKGLMCAQPPPRHWRSVRVDMFLGFGINYTQLLVGNRVNGVCDQRASHFLMQARVQDSSGRNLKHSNTIHQMFNTQHDNSI